MHVMHGVLFVLQNFNQLTYTIMTDLDKHSEQFFRLDPASPGRIVVAGDLTTTPTDLFLVSGNTQHLKRKLCLPAAWLFNAGSVDHLCSACLHGLYCLCFLLLLLF